MAKNNATVDRIQAVWNKLGGESGVDRLLRGELEVVQKLHIIDLDADPFVPEGLLVEEHRKGGQFEWDPSKISLWLSEGQKNGCVQGHKLRQELRSQRVLNTNLLDYLLAHTELIPCEWKDNLVFFWGTIYHDSDGYLYVRYLGCVGDRWDSYCHWLKSDWPDDGPTAVFRG